MRLESLIFLYIHFLCLRALKSSIFNVEMFTCCRCLHQGPACWQSLMQPPKNHGVSPLGLSAPYSAVQLLSMRSPITHARTAALRLHLAPASKLIKYNPSNTLLKLADIHFGLLSLDLLSSSVLPELAPTCLEKVALLPVPTRMSLSKSGSLQTRSPFGAKPRRLGQEGSHEGLQGDRPALDLSMGAPHK